MVKVTLQVNKIKNLKHNFLQFLIKTNKLSQEQKESINEILENFPLRNSSETYKSVLLIIIHLLLL